MKIGIFDSGLGGLMIGQAIHKLMPEYDLVYLGDTLHLPYGGRSAEAVYQLTKNAVDFLFREQDCHLIILACNTACACALRRLQQEYLPEHFPDRRILGVVVPVLETAIEQGGHEIGLIATERLIESQIYEEELKKLNPNIQIHSKATPLLVPMIENKGEKWLPEILSEYMKALPLDKLNSLILGCTHYTKLKPEIEKRIQPKTHIIAQDEIIPEKLADYLRRHPEHQAHLSRDGQCTFLFTDITESYVENARKIWRDSIKFKKAKYYD